jgi:hypothetical protein
MRAIWRFVVASISLLLAAAPAAAVDIAPALDGSSWEKWAELAPTILEFDDGEWQGFLCTGESEFLLPPLGALEADFGAADMEGLLTQVWQRP